MWAVGTADLRVCRLWPAGGAAAMLKSTFGGIARGARPICEFKDGLWQKDLFGTLRWSSGRTIDVSDAAA